MPAQNFKTAAELGLSDIEHEALVTTLYALEREEITKFDMSTFYQCGTPACLCGWANHFSRNQAFPETTSQVFIRDSVNLLINRLPPALLDLFMIDTGYDSDSMTPLQGAQALRNYLTYGTARWDEVLV